MRLKYNIAAEDGTAQPGAGIGLFFFASNEGVLGVMILRGVKSKGLREPHKVYYGRAIRGKHCKLSGVMNAFRCECYS